MMPKEVKKYKLLEVCELVAGARATKSETGIFPIYGAGANSIGTSDSSNCPAGSIRLTRKGTIGNVYLHDKPFWAEADCFIVEPKEVIDKMYLFHWLLMKQKELGSCAEGTIMPGLSLHRLSHLEIEVPNMEYQKQAVVLLEKILDMSEWFIQSIPVEIGLLQRKSQGYLEDYVNKLGNTHNSLEDLE
ncbi:restriction endonuclease subunit S [Streptococcus suis]|uniref:restriction endonuclease subunit S n=1 Tax=Streptococcus suis TaxID=1307 RepID=UPI00040B888C|nr:restriction endonuclease subunit S [Streptococcus suis]HEM3170562.1 restriction endonuclease subunit S [Streptococcus suis]